MFGGLSQDIINCNCGYSHELLIQKMAEILPIQLIVYTIQSCIEAFFFSEEVDWRCPNCGLEKCLKSVEVICPPSTLIIQLLHIVHDEVHKVTIKKHTPILCPENVVLGNGASYALSSVINHEGEASDSGHYNIVIFDKPKHKFILLDDIEITDNVDLKDMVQMSYVATYIRI